MSTHSNSIWTGCTQRIDKNYHCIIAHLTNEKKGKGIAVTFITIHELSAQNLVELCNSGEKKVTSQ